MLLLPLLLSRFSRVRLCVTPQKAANQAPLFLGFSRQEYWSGLPFPSPMHACMLSCFSRVRLYATLWTAAPRLLCPQDSPGKNTRVGCHFLLQQLLSCFSRVRLCATPQTATHQAPPSLGFSRQEHWSGLPFPSPDIKAIYLAFYSISLNQNTLISIYQTRTAVCFSFKK